MNLRHVVKYTIYGHHVKLEFQCYFKCTYSNLAVVNIIEGGINMVDTTGLILLYSATYCIHFMNFI
jgi:hypothetical protein